jgi:xanthine dehydrogenase YagR molybdenum-binding subunit
VATWAGRTAPAGRPGKLTGTAVYAADTPMAGVAYAVLVPATVPAGRVAYVDTAAATAAPGVFALLIHADVPRLGLIGTPPLGQSVFPLQDDRVRYDGQPAAAVAAGRRECRPCGRPG